MRRALGIFAAAAAFLLVASVSYADKRPHEGKVVRIETVEKSVDAGGQTVSNVQRSMVVQGERGDQWTLF